MAQKFKPIEIQPDPVYGNLVLAKFINCLMQRGKKSVAQKIVYSAFDLVKKSSPGGSEPQEPLDVFLKALREATPQIEVRARRVGGATYQVPREVKEKRGMSLAMRWITNAARAKKGKAMAKKLAEEIIMAAKGEGEAIKKKMSVHKMAEANRAFAHFAPR
ncbi:MAG: 30S ribosomal protein S7 [Patescibacteria group bacterium]|nr:30S ribosomal protein S7 [Patescibacteria group bacterium]